MKYLVDPTFVEGRKKGVGDAIKTRLFPYDRGFKGQDFGKEKGYRRHSSSTPVDETGIRFQNESIGDIRKELGS